MGLGAGMAGEISRGDVFLYAFPVPDKVRPVVVLTRQNLIKHLVNVTVAPITSTVRDTKSQVRLDEGDGMKQPRAVNLLNLQTIPKSRLKRRVAELSSRALAEIEESLQFSLGLDMHLTEDLD